MASSSSRSRVTTLRLPPLKRRERPFENRLRSFLEGKGVLFIKLKPTRKGFPDRLAVFNGKTKLVEVKREGEDLDDVQKLVHKELHDRGVYPLVVHGPDVKLAAGAIIETLYR